MSELERWGYVQDNYTSCVATHGLHMRGEESGEDGRKGRRRGREGGEERRRGGREKGRGISDLHGFTELLHILHWFFL